MIPVTILTGFLGAGKTTLLNNILHGDHGLRVAVLVNDFGTINIDSQLVVDVDEDTVSLSNGCICCTIRGDLLAALEGLISRDDPPEYIIIEASGVSDPLEIALTFKVPSLQNSIQVDSILTVIDADQVRSLERENEFLAVLQVGAADIVVLNKVDLAAQEQLEEVRRWVRSIIPNARILETTYGRVPLDLILGVGQFSPERLLKRGAGHDIHVHAADHDHDHHHHDHSLIFSTWSWTSSEPLVFKEVQRAVDRLPSNIYRAKGLLYLADDPDRVCVLQVVGKRASLTWDRPWRPDESRFSQVVFIGAHDTLDTAALDQQMTATTAANAPKSELQRVTRNVLSWLRGV